MQLLLRYPCRLLCEVFVFKQECKLLKGSARSFWPQEVDADNLECDETNVATFVSMRGTGGLCLKLTIAGISILRFPFQSD